ncbi:hypothetical protein [Ochrobactrum sp. S1502_03]|uniref:hypothetical protein n=1 Tax=Ochrobactrum sp. S1502_03 TaxID=3108451 RepID=UPI0037CC98DE
MSSAKKYAYPAFMSVSALVTTISDLIQKNDIALILAACLGVIGLLALLAPYRLLEKTRPLLSDGNATNTDFSFRSFGVSCLIMGAVVFGFSSLSVRAAPEGGIIASQYPEIHQIQQSLGLVQTDIATIKGTVKEINDKSDKIIAATFPWLSLSIDASFNSAFVEKDGRVHNVNSAGGAYVLVENETPVNFENVDIIVTNPIDTTDNYIDRYAFIGSNERKPAKLASNKLMYTIYNVCYSAKVKGRNEWIVDNFEVRATHDIVKMTSDDWYNIRYEKVDYDGPQIYAKEKRCSL